MLFGWLVVLVASIIALRQHTDGDTFTGVALGLVAGWNYRGRRLRS